MTKDRLTVQNISEIIKKLKDREQQEFIVGKEAAGRIYVQRINRDYVTRPDDIRAGVESVGTAEQIAEEVHRYGGGFAKLPEKSSLLEKREEIKSLVTEQQKASDPPVRKGIAR
ncbi:hypothetical protein NST44_30905 [Paenibacillus sp. FSL W8-0919]|uniref:hypothetical protein n=1 Tax=Paenibacillus sp. FSL W8-0919 TaxID=2954707 RepID=UPI0030FAF648